MTDTTPEAIRALAYRLTDVTSLTALTAAATLRALAAEKEQVATAAGVHCTWPSCEHTARGQCLPSIRALPVSSKLVQAAEEVAAIARGEAPAARIHMNGHAYIPETAARDARRAALEEAAKFLEQQAKELSVYRDQWPLRDENVRNAAAIRALIDREPAPVVGDDHDPTNPFAPRPRSAVPAAPTPPEPTP